MTTKEMIAEYNRLTGKNIKKFSSRAAGEKQLIAARKKHGPEKVETVGRAEAVRESWNVKKTAAARSKKDNVAVEGHGEFRSVKQAFEKLKLPIGKHIRFRGELKSAGKLAFEYNNHTFKFTVVKQQELEKSA